MSAGEAGDDLLSRRRMLAACGTLGFVATSRAHAANPEMERILAGAGSANDKLRALMPAIVQALRTERCFIYMRDPRARRTALWHPRDCGAQGSKTLVDSGSRFH